MKNLIGRKAKIISDNDTYDKYRDEILTITHADNEGRGYDNALYPEMLCSFKMESGKEFPLSLYEYEFELI